VTVANRSYDIDALIGADAIAALGEPTATARGLPPKVYFDPEIFEAECELVFPRTWLAVALASDIPGPGDAKAVNVANRNVLLVRDEKGRVNAFYNTCRHRGMKLVTEPASCLRSITCPFHAWTYALDGRLRGTPYLGGVGKHQLDGFVRDDLGLVGIRLGEWCNTLFVNFDGQAPPLEEHLAPLVAHLGGDRDWSALHHHAGGGIHQVDLQGNWKENVEVSLEEYHLKFAHPQVFAGIDPLTWRDQPVVDRHLWGEDAWLSGSYGAGYEYYSGPPLPRWLERGERWQTYVLLFPNLGIFATSDQLAIEIVSPRGPERHDFRQEYYFAPEVAGDATYAPAVTAIVDAWLGLLEQDGALLDGLRENRRTNQYIENPTRFAGNWELGLHRFQQHYVEALRAGSRTK